MAKVQFQVDGLDSNQASIFNDDVTFDGNVDANSISIGGVDINSIFSGGGGGSSISVQSTGVNGALISELTGINTIKFDTTTGFNVADGGTGSALISLNSSFKTWNVDGEEGLIAVGEDTVNIVSGEGVSISANNTTGAKTLTISATGGGSGTAATLNTFFALI
jgi:hypothetical protein